MPKIIPHKHKSEHDNKNVIEAAITAPWWQVTHEPHQSLCFTHKK